MWFRKRKAKPADVARSMRENVFSLPAHDVGVASAPGHTHVWIVLMETGYPEAVASLVTIADGTTSLYFSKGGGIIGAGQHPAVRVASDHFITLVDARVGELALATEHPLPASGRVRFYARTFEDLRTAEASEQELGENRHPLSPIFHAGHAVIAAVRETTAER